MRRFSPFQLLIIVKYLCH